MNSEQESMNSAFGLIRTTMETSGKCSKHSNKFVFRNFLEIKKKKNCKPL